MFLNQITINDKALYLKQYTEKIHFFNRLHILIKVPACQFYEL